MSTLNPVRESSTDYVWTFPGSPIRIHLSLAVVARLREQLFTGFDPSSSREIGGLLLGKVHAGGIHVKDIRSFCPSDNGSYFILSDIDKVNLKDVIKEQQGAGSLVVGYFRSDQRGGIRLSEEDLSLSRELFSDPEQVFLIISKPDNNTPKAGFFFWDAGSIFAEASFLQFALDEKLLAIPRTSSLSQEVSIPAPAEDQVSASDTNIKPAPTIRSRSILWVAGLLLLAIVAVATAYRILKPPSQSSVVAARSENPSLSLSATHTDGSATVMWDAKLPVIADARIGVLTIQDGASQTEFPLTRAQLQIGKLIYVTQADRLDLNLEIFSKDGKAIRESLMLAFPQTTTKSQLGQEPDGDLPIKQTGLQNLVVANTFLAEKAPAVVRTFAASSAANRAPQPTVVLFEAPLSTPITTVDPAVIKIPEFLASSLDQKTAQKSSESIAAEHPVLQPPMSLRQVRPIVPANVSSMLKRRVEVQVRISIDQAGRVVKAEPVGSAEGMNQYLGTSAANAARLWVFQPARRGNTPVMSELTLKFVFGPATGKQDD
ncbi:MAG TPA: hypothetical protein VEX68_09020 [Bryobacteraceae bacterium]|nr:hypothetical protein [Bryobacteraceae bacterium]